MKIFLFESDGLRANGDAYTRLKANCDAVLPVCFSNAG
jgi:hypothetical protein